MPQWNEIIYVSDVFHNESMTYEDKRDTIVGRVKKSNWYQKRPGTFLEDIAEGLATAEDTEDFDYWWDQLYDWADYDRVWIATF